MLNALLMVAIIVMSIFLSMNLVLLSAKHFSNVNPFAIYQIAIAINYFSSFPGDFSVEVPYPGIDKGEFRVTSYINLNTGNSYVSEGVCEIKDHLAEIGYAALDAFLYSIPVGEISGEITASAVRSIVFKTILEAGKVFLISEVLSEAITAIYYSSQGNFMDFLYNFVKRFSQENIEAFKDTISQQGVGFAEVAGRMLLTTAIRLALSALEMTGWGFAVAFAANFLIGIAGTLYEIIQGMWNPTYNCLMQVGPTKQTVYVQFNKIDFSQNLYRPLTFVNKEFYRDNSKLVLAAVVDGWLYKVSMKGSLDKTVYTLDNVMIYTKGNKIIIEPEFKKENTK